MNKFSLIWSNLFRRKVRTFLTLFSVLVAFLLFALLRTVAGAFEVGIDFAGVDRLNVSPKYSIIDPLPITHLNEIDRLEGVASITHQTWFGGTYQGLNNFFPKFPVNPRAYFAMYSEFEISDVHLEAFANSRTGAVVPESMARQYDWQVGDRIPIEGDIWLMADGGKLWEFDLVGTYTTGGEAGLSSAFLFNYDYFDEARVEQTQGLVGWFTVKVANPDEAAALAAEIDMNGILSAVFFTILLLTANTMMQTFRERIPELAVLKTVGFTDVAVSLLIMSESILLCALGGALGIGLAILVSDAIGPQVEAFFGTFRLSTATIGTGMAIAVLLGIVVGLFPALSANRLQIVDALRK